MHAYRSLATLNGDDDTKQDQGHSWFSIKSMSRWTNNPINVHNSMRAKHGIIPRLITGDLQRRNSEYWLQLFFFLQQKLCIYKLTVYGSFITFENIYIQI